MVVGPPQFPSGLAGSEGSIAAETDIDIVNAALIQLGQSPISQFGQNSGSGLILQASYNRSRNDLLRRQPWNFARQFVSLVALAQAPISLDLIPEAANAGLIMYTAAYQLPNDCLRVFRFSPKDCHWRIVGRAIYSDAVPATVTGPLLGAQTPTTSGTDNIPISGSFGASATVGIEYIKLVTDCNMWDAIFRQCFVFKLMKELSFGITGLIQAYTMAKNEFDESMKEAAGINGIENWPDPYWNSDLTTARYGYVGVTVEGY